MNISFIVPVFNEEESIRILYSGLKKIIVENNELISDHEIIFINDGSTDCTVNRIHEIQDGAVKLLSFGENKGKSAALVMGFMAASHDVIVTMDSDLQCDLEDIPKLLRKLDSGFDCVCGWRYEKASGFVKNFSSRIANFVRAKYLNDNIHDSNSPLKVIKKKAVDNMFYFHGFHRFIPYLVMDQGFSVCEVKVRQLPRQYGISKYGTWGRLKKTVGDLLVMIWLKKNLIRLHRENPQETITLPDT